MLSPDTIEQFIRQVEARAFDDAYIDPREEQEIMKLAAEQEIPPLDAAALLRQACSRHQFALESEVRGMLTIVLEQFCANDGRIDCKEFTDAVAIGSRLLQRAAPRADIPLENVERIAVDIVLRQGYSLHRSLRKHIDSSYPRAAAR